MSEPAAMTFAADFADPALVLGLIGMVGLTTLACGWVRVAVAWLSASSATLALVMVLKVTTLTGWIAGGLPPISPGLVRPGAFMLRSPSGHTASAVVVYGGLAMILGSSRPGWITVGVAAGVVMGGIRVAMWTHSVAESVVGAAAGLGGVFLMAWAAGPVPRASARWAVAVTALAVIVALHGRHLRVEHTLEAFAGQLAAVRR